LSPAPPGSGWLVMDDLKMTGGWGGAVSLTTGYSNLRSAVSDQAFMDLGVMPLLAAGSSGSPSVGIGSNPDTISDPRAGFDVRLSGTAASPLRLGAGAELIIPSGERTDYVTDGTYRGMFRLLAAGDTDRFTYAGHVAVHIRPLSESTVPGGPKGNEFLFGAGAARKFPMRNRWQAIIGPEFFGETAVDSPINTQNTGIEGLLTGRLERTGDGPNFRLKLGAGHGVVQHFGAPAWRIVFSVELFGHRSNGTNSAGLP
jgi:hypothetical protein